MSVHYENSYECCFGRCPYCLRRHGGVIYPSCNGVGSIIPALRRNVKSADAQLTRSERQLAQKALHDLGFGLLLGQTERTQFEDLLACNFTDGSLVDERRILVVRGKLGRSIDRTMAMMMASHSLWPVHGQLPRTTERNS